MTSVFIGGSRRLARLSNAIRSRLENIVAQELDVLIGDANGIDKAVQEHLALVGYRKVTVYCMDERCRNNVGGWPTRNVRAERSKRDFAYYATKDAEMAKAASCGFMIWDGKSRGTLNNIANLLRANKKVAVYFSPQKSSTTIRSLADLRALIDKCPANDRRRLERDLLLPSGRPPASQDLFAQRRE